VLLVMPHDFNSIFDLDNIVCLSNNESNKELSKYVVGFISDLVGPVSMPLYSVALYKSFTDQLKETLHGQDIKEFMKNREICLV
jgi:rRNA processing protein Gar1